MSKGSESTPKQKKPFYKKWWFILLVIVVLIGIIGNLGSGGKNKEESNSNTSEISELADNNESENSSEENTDSSVAEISSSEDSQIEITGGDLGVYGKQVELKAADGSVADTRYEYTVPVGSYKVTNNGSNMLQLDIVYEEISKDSDGNEYQEIAGSPQLLDAGESVVVTIEEGTCIELEEGETITLEVQ